MKTKVTALIAFINLFLTSLFAQTGTYVPQLVNFDIAMVGFMSRNNIPGGQLAITRMGKLVYNRGFGLANIASGDSVYPNSVFRIASLSKPVTAVAVMKLYEKGLISLNAKVFGARGILNDTTYQTLLDPRDTLITIRMLLQHTGGWDATILGDPMFENTYNIATIMGVPSPPSSDVIIKYVLANKMLDFNPGTQTAYSNFGFCVLGKVIEKVTGQLYTNYVRDSILSPVGITTIQPGFNLLTSQLPNEVTYYDYPTAPYLYSIYDNTTLVPAPYGGFNMESMDALGRWVGPAADVVKLICGFDRFNTRPDFLTVATIDTMTKPSTANANVACGLGVDNINKNWWHYGSLYGSSSALIRFKASQVNMVMLFNSNDTLGNIYPAMSNVLWNVVPTIGSWPVFDLFSGMENIGNEPDFSVYPNPAFYEIIFNSSENIKEIKVLDLHGKEIFSQYYTNHIQNIRIPVTGFEDGIYLVKMSNGEGSFVRKLIIKKN